MPPVQLVPRKVPAISGSRAQFSRYAWSIRLRPTSPLELGRPEASISRAFSIALAARTKILPRTIQVECRGEFGSAYALTSMPLTRPVSGSRITLEPTVWASRSTLPRSSALDRVLAALYLAWTGQIGTQLLLPWQRPPSSTWLVLTAPAGVNPLPPSYAGLGMPLRACGKDRTWSSILLAVQLDEGAVDALAHHLVEVGQRQLVHRVDVARLEVGAEEGLVLDLRRDAELALGLGVERHQLVVADRPVPAHAVAGVQVEVLGQHPRGLAPPSASWCRRAPGCRWCRWRTGRSGRGSRCCPAGPARSGGRRCCAASARWGWPGTATGCPWTRWRRSGRGSPRSPRANGPRPIPASRTRTRLPARLSSSAMIAPLMPPPTTTAS